MVKLILRILRWMDNHPWLGEAGLARSQAAHTAYMKTHNIKYYRTGYLGMMVPVYGRAKLVPYEKTMKGVLEERKRWRIAEEADIAKNGPF